MLTLNRLSNWLTFSVVVIAFILSFGALRDLAAEVGIIYPALYPIMIDAGLVIYNIMALQSSLNGERNRYAWGLIILATIASVCLNVVHALDELPSWLATILGPAMAAIPPLVIFGAFHLVVLRIEQQAKLSRTERPNADPITEQTAVRPKQPDTKPNDSVFGPNAEQSNPRTVNPNNQSNAVSFAPNGPKTEPNAQPNRVLFTPNETEQAQTYPPEPNGTKPGPETAEQYPLPERLLSTQAANPNGQTPRTAAGQANSEPEPRTKQYPNGTRTEQVNTRTLPGPNSSLFDSNTEHPNGETGNNPNTPNSDPNGQAFDKQTAVDNLLIYVSKHPNATLAEIGAHIGRSKSTVSKYLSDLTAAGRLAKNGRGWQVTEKEK